MTNSERDLFNTHSFKLGDEVILIKKLDHKKFDKIDIGEIYTVGFFKTDNAISLKEVNPLRVGIFNASCFQLVTDYKKEVTKMRLKKVKFLQKPNWYRRLYVWFMMTHLKSWMRLK